MSLFVARRFVEVILWSPAFDKGWSQHTSKFGFVDERIYRWVAGDYANSRVQLYPRSGRAAEWFEVEKSPVLVDGFAFHLPEAHKAVERDKEKRKQRARFLRYRNLRFESGKWDREPGKPKDDLVRYEAAEAGARLWVERVGGFSYVLKLANKEAAVVTRGDVLIVALRENDTMTAPPASAPIDPPTTSPF